MQSAAPCLGACLNNGQGLFNGGDLERRIAAAAAARGCRRAAAPPRHPRRQHGAAAAAAWRQRRQVGAAGGARRRRAAAGGRPGRGPPAAALAVVGVGGQDVVLLGPRSVLHHVRLQVAPVHRAILCHTRRGPNGLLSLQARGGLESVCEVCGLGAATSPASCTLSVGHQASGGYRRHQRRRPSWGGVCRV
jgi:hypothetical protein